MSEPYGQLVIQLPDKTSRTEPLRLGRITIGRTPENDVVLNSPLVSHRHAELEITESGTFLMDLGSREGTFAAGVRLLPNQPTPIEDGAVLQIGLFLINYIAAPASAAAPEPKPKSRAKTPVEPVPQPTGVVFVPIQQPPPPAPPRVAQGFEHFLRQLSSAQNGELDTTQSFYLAMLPVIFHDQDFLGRFLTIFERLWEPLEWRQDHIEMYFDPRTAPVTFLRWLERWLGLEPNQHWNESRRRRFLIEAMSLYQWRGTTWGVQRMIEVCTGFTVQVEESAPYCFTVSVHLDDLESAGAPGGQNPETYVEGLKRFVEELIVQHKPAHAGYTLEFV